jgi:hypothetical protein
MIEDIFGMYLLKYHNHVTKLKEKLEFENKNDTCICIVCSLNCFWLPFVINNMFQKTNFRYPLYFFGNKLVNAKIENVFPNYNIKYFDLGSYIFIVPKYNELLTSSDFWKKFQEKNVVIFQPDCIILRDLIASDYKYHYIGALCGDLNEDKYVMNGGLSLRNRDKMIDICDAYKPNSNENEDIFFTRILREQNQPIPSLSECFNFSIETFGSLELCFGIHGTTQYNHSSEIDEWKSKFQKLYLH